MMKTQTLRFAAVAAVLVAGIAGAAEGNGKKTTVNREVTAFTRVDVRGSLDVTVRRGAKHTVAVTIDSNLQDAVITSVEGDTLVIQLKTSGWLDGLRWKGEGRVAVEMPELTAARAAGSGNLAIAGFEAKQLDLAASGSGDVRFAGAAQSLDLETTGSGDMEIALTAPSTDIRVETNGSGDVNLAGTSTDKLDIRTTGSGDVKAHKIAARGGQFSSSGSGNIDVTLNGGEARFRTSGSGDINWRGSANVTSSKAGGSGEIEHED